MTSDIDKRARTLLEQEDQLNEQREKRKAEQEQASRLTAARSRIKQHDREIEQEQARKAAKVEADALAVELGERATTLQREAEALARSIEAYAELRARLQGAQRRSGRGAGDSRAASLRFILPNWFKSVFGGHNSLSGVESERAGRAQALTPEPRALVERDPLASARTNPDMGEAS